MSKVINIDGTKGRYCYIDGTRGVIGLRDYKPTYPSCPMDDEWTFDFQSWRLYYSGWCDSVLDETGEDRGEPGFSFANDLGIDMQTFIYNEGDDWWYSSSTAYYSFWDSIETVADEIRRVYIFDNQEAYDSPQWNPPEDGDNYDWFSNYYHTGTLMAVLENGKYHNKPGYWVVIPDDGLFS